MKTKKITIVLLLIAYSLSGYGTNSNSLNTVVVEADFSGIDRDNVINIYCQVGYTTTFELPEGRTFKYMLPGDKGGWRVETAEGSYGFVTPKEQGLITSLSIVDDKDQLYMFNLIERTAVAGKQLVARVKIIITPSTHFIKPGVTSEKLDFKGPEKKTIEEIVDSGRKYQISKENYWSIVKVIDDRVFTYVYLPRAQYRPAIFYCSPKEKIDMEPIKYVDKEQYYLIHRVLSGDKDFFVLKIGDRETRLQIAK